LYGLFVAFYAAVVIFAGLAALSWWAWLLLITAGVCWLIDLNLFAVAALVSAALNATYRIGFALGAEAGAEAAVTILRKRRATRVRRSVGET
jgi:hypothetical protein